MTAERETHSTEAAARAGQVLSRRLGVPLALGGAALTVAAVIADPAGAPFGYLTGFILIWSVVMGALFFLAMHHLTHAVWSVSVRRVMEMVTAMLPIVALLFIPVLFLAQYLYEWTHPDIVAADPVLLGKAAYLNFPFFIARAAICFAAWIAFGLFFVRASLCQDRGGDSIEPVKKMRRLSAPFTILFGFTITFAAFDWLMSLEPHWFSAIFGVYVFAGSAVAGLAAIILFVLWLRKRGLLADSQGRPMIGEPHLYHLGTLLFAFSCFWGYIALSQHLLIWYANLPEETFWFAQRWRGGWMGASLVLMLARFILPFFLLLGRAAKSSPLMLAIMASLALFGQLVDVVWLIFPSSGLDFSRIWLSAGPVLLMSAIFLTAAGRFVAARPIVPVKDPLLEEARRYHL